MSEIELSIDSIAAGGDGVGRTDGMVVFVPRTAPGDRGRVRAESRGRFLRGELVELTTASAVRTTPPCDHYVADRCGGCQLQHITYRAQLAAKAAIIRDALQRIGKIQVDVPVVEPSDSEWRYRRKLTLTFRRTNGSWTAGLRRYDDPDAVFALRDCPITDENVMAAWRDVLREQHLLPDAPELRASVRLLPDGFSFVVEGAKQWKDHDALFQAIPAMMQLWWKPGSTQSRRLLHSRGASSYAGASFTQVNPGVATRLRDYVLSVMSAHGPRYVVDAYAGTGDTAVAVAGQGARVVAIELDKHAAQVCSSRLPSGSRAISAAVEDALPGTLPADVVILNPPRGGLNPRVTEALANQRPAPSAVVYVSCDPATLARDLRRLPGYRIHSLRGFDMFPQTAHVETVCELVPAA